MHSSCEVLSTVNGLSIATSRDLGNRNDLSERHFNVECCLNMGIFCIQSIISRLLGCIQEKFGVTHGVCILQSQAVIIKLLA